MALFKRLERPRRLLTMHGFRSSFTRLGIEATTTPNDVVEMALAHAIKNKVEAAYRRGDLLEKRRKLDGRLGRLLRVASGRCRRAAAHQHGLSRW